MGKLFGTDGVRGIANKELTAELAYKVGKVGSYVLASKAHHKPKILVGVDTRISCDMLQNALVSGILSAGGDVHILGVVPTPAVAYLVRLYNADAGVMISASHNPMEYNGIKFFNKDGFKLSDEIEDEIEDIIFNKMEKLPTPVGDGIGRMINSQSALDDYVSFVKSTSKVDISSLNILIDCANGATSVAAKQVFEGLGAKVDSIHNKPNGININDKCGSTHMDDLKEQLLKGNYDIGLAFDGDGDRLLAMTSKGELIDGDLIISIIANHLKEKNELNENTVVGTIMSNLGLKIMCKENNLTFIETKVGDRYVLEEMLKGNYSIGGEQSGHVILLKYNTTGDGIMSALKLLNVMCEKNESLENLSKVMTVMPQVLKNITVKNEFKDTIMSDNEIEAEKQNIEERLMGKGRVVLRASGTEPLIRVMIEGPEIAIIEKEAQILVDLINKKI